MQWAGDFGLGTQEVKGFAVVQLTESSTQRAPQGKTSSRPSCAPPAAGTGPGFCGCGSITVPPALVPLTSAGDLSTAPVLGGSGCGTGASLRGVGGPLTYFLSGRLNKSKLKAIELCLFYFIFFPSGYFPGSSPISANELDGNYNTGHRRIDYWWLCWQGPRPPRWLRMGQLVGVQL